MKKFIKTTVVMLCVIAVVLTVAGCYRTNTPNNAVPNNNTGTNASDSVMTNNNAGANAANSDAAITEEQAKDIALQKAGLTADEVIFDRVEFDRDDGVDHYEVEFRKDRTEYNADIAMDGTIISWEVDND